MHVRTSARACSVRRESRTQATHAHDKFYDILEHTMIYYTTLYYATLH